jgi:hypothetical protein
MLSKSRPPCAASAATGGACLDGQVYDAVDFKCAAIRNFDFRDLLECGEVLASLCLADLCHGGKTVD